MTFTFATIGNFMKDFWYIFAIIGVVFLIYLYSKLDAYTKHKLKSVFSGKVFLVCLFIFWWLIWAFVIGGSTEMKYANFFMPLGGLFLLATIFWLSKLRYETPQIQTPNFHASMSEPPISVNGFLIYGCDTISAGGIHWPYADRILVVPEETSELLRRGAFSIAKVSPVMKYQLPEEVVEEIQRHPYLKRAKEFYYGWFDDIKKVDWEFSQLKTLEKYKKETLYGVIQKTLDVKNPKISTLLNLYTNLCKFVNKQGEYFNATIETQDTGNEFFNRTRDIYSNKPQDPPQKVERGNEEY